MTLRLRRVCNPPVQDILRHSAKKHSLICCLRNSAFDMCSFGGGTSVFPPHTKFFIWQRPLWEWSSCAGRAPGPSYKKLVLATSKPRPHQVTLLSPTFSELEQVRPRTHRLTAQNSDAVLDRLADFATETIFVTAYWNTCTNTKIQIWRYRACSILLDVPFQNRCTYAAESPGQSPGITAWVPAMGKRLLFLFVIIIP